MIDKYMFPFMTIVEALESVDSFRQLLIEIFLLFSFQVIVLRKELYLTVVGSLTTSLSTNYDVCSYRSDRPIEMNGQDYFKLYIS
jgi:hypothetical protein